MASQVLFPNELMTYRVRVSHVSSLILTISGFALYKYIFFRGRKPVRMTLRCERANQGNFEYLNKQSVPGVHLYQNYVPLISDPMISGFVECIENPKSFVWKSVVQKTSRALVGLSKRRL